MMNDEIRKKIESLQDELEEHFDGLAKVVIDYRPDSNDLAWIKATATYSIHYRSGVVEVDQTQLDRLISIYQEKKKSEQERKLTRIVDSIFSNEVVR